MKKGFLMEKRIFGGEKDFLMEKRIFGGEKDFDGKKDFWWRKGF